MLMQMIGDDVSRAAEPERREQCQHAPLVGDAIRQNRVEGGEAVGGDHQQMFAQIIGVANLAATKERQRRDWSEVRPLAASIWYSLSCIVVDMTPSVGMRTGVAQPAISYHSRQRFPRSWVMARQ